MGAQSRGGGQLKKNTLYEGGDLEDGFVENCDEDSEKEEGESFLPRSAVAKRCSFRLIFKKNAPVLCKLGSVLTAQEDLQDVTENQKNSTFVTFSLEAVK